MNDSIKPELIHASEICANQLLHFIEYVQKVDPELKHPEATMVAASILNELPSAFANDPEMLSALKKACEKVKRRRK